MYKNQNLSQGSSVQLSWTVRRRSVYCVVLALVACLVCLLGFHARPTDDYSPTHDEQFTLHTPFKPFIRAQDIKGLQQ